MFGCTCWLCVMGGSSSDEGWNGEENFLELHDTDESVAAYFGLESALFHWYSIETEASWWKNNWLVSVNKQADCVMPPTWNLKIWSAKRKDTYRRQNWCKNLNCRSWLSAVRKFLLSTTDDTSACRRSLLEKSFSSSLISWSCGLWLVEIWSVMTFWVHTPIAGQFWKLAARFDTVINPYLFLFGIWLQRHKKSVFSHWRLQRCQRLHTWVTNVILIAISYVCQQGTW